MFTYSILPNQCRLHPLGFAKFQRWPCASDRMLKFNDQFQEVPTGPGTWKWLTHLSHMLYPNSHHSSSVPAIQNTEQMHGHGRRKCNKSFHRLLIQVMFKYNVMTKSDLMSRCNDMFVTIWANSCHFVSAVVKVWVDSMQPERKKQRHNKNLHKNDPVSCASIIYTQVTIGSIL